MAQPAYANFLCTLTSLRPSMNGPETLQNTLGEFSLFASMSVAIHQNGRCHTHTHTHKQDTVLAPSKTCARTCCICMPLNPGSKSSVEGEDDMPAMSRMPPARVFCRWTRARYSCGHARDGEKPKTQSPTSPCLCSSNNADNRTTRCLKVTDVHHASASSDEHFSGPSSLDEHRLQSTSNLCARELCDSRYPHKGNAHHAQPNAVSETSIEQP